MREVIVSQLWIGNASEARDVRALGEAGITAIIDLADNESPAWPPRDRIYIRVPLSDDGENSPSRLRLAIDATTKLIQQPDQRILVACSAGMSRSPAIVAAAIHRHGRGSLKDCLKLACQDARCDVSPALWNAITRLWE